MSKKILEIEIPPLVASQYLAYCLAVLQTESRTLNYYYTHYIQWVCHLDDEKNDMYLEFENSSCFNCPEIKISWKEKEEVKDVIQTIRDTIEEGNFVLIDGADVYYLENTLGFQKSHYGHDFLVYGYDDVCRVIYMMAYSVNRKLEKYTCSQEAIINAFTSDYVDQGFGCACSVRPRAGKKIILDRKKIQIELERYLMLDNIVIPSENIDSVSGYQVYQYMLQYMSRTKPENVLLYSKDLRVFMEHKKAMLHRILRLQREFPTEPFGEIAKRYQKIYAKSEVFWLLLLKYGQTKEIEYLERIKNIILTIEKQEYPILNSLVSIL